MRTIVWFRGKDLRLADHEPLAAAISGGEVIPLFVLDPYFFAPERAARIAPRMQFLLDSLAELASGLEARGSRLVLVSGRSVDVVPKLARRWRVNRVVAHRWVEPIGRERDRRVAAALAPIPFELHEGEMLHPPGLLRTGAGAPYSVFSAFARALSREAHIGRPRAAPRRIPPPPEDVRAPALAVPGCTDLGIPRNPRLLPGGERAGRARLRAFLRGPAARYAVDRDRLDLAGTSRLSADLKFGTLSVRAVWWAAEEALGGAAADSLRAFRTELLWREFAYSTLWDRPELLAEPFRIEWRGFPWRRDRAGWRAWVEGTTGYPVVDAAARQLLDEGFVHNRARMIAASFLAKHLLIDFRAGEAHYMAHLTDGDWASNDLGWQWSAGCGCDAQPYFRVFNPVLQGRRFDPTGDYVRRWVPELARLPDRWLHEPWAAPAAVLDQAGVTLGRSYPAPIVEHQSARRRFLEVAAAHLRGGRAASAKERPSGSAQQDSGNRSQK